MVTTLDNQHAHTNLLPLLAKERKPVLLCLSHLRWNFVFQRPQHLMIRWARDYQVVFFEEPVVDKCSQPGCDEEYIILKPRENGVVVATPHLPAGLSKTECVTAQQRLLDQLMASYQIGDHLLWYYTPMAIPFTRHLLPRVVVYDCMDELSAFANAPPELRANESELFARADVVLTGGRSLYEAKRTQHDNVHLFPSSVDQAHFARAREKQKEPVDQAAIPLPRLGFFGVIDERMDLTLLDGVAKARPDWHFVLLGPVVKIDLSSLPRRNNLHYLGMKAYEELPAYLSGWAAALLPFARNEATRFISPTKIPEYLAAGKKVISTSIRDVVHPYGEMSLVRIADTVPEFVASIAAALSEDSTELLSRIDLWLGNASWDRTWEQMKLVIDTAARRRVLSVRRGAHV